MKYVMVPVLHVYSQPGFHSDVIMVGNDRGLRALYEALGELLKKGNSVEISEVFVTDGEGYDVIVVKENKEENLTNLVAPYTEEYAMDNRFNAVSPFDILNEKEYQEKLNIIRKKNHVV